MFGKLLKYELKSVGKWYLTLNAAVLLVSIILGLVLKALGGNFSTDTNSTSAQIFTIILVLLLAMVISGSLLSTLAIIIKRFYSNIFGRQGYLTLTLPVTTNQIICSKLLASLLWSIFNIFIVIIGIILVSSLSLFQKSIKLFHLRTLHFLSPISFYRTLQGHY